MQQSLLRPHAREVIASQAGRCRRHAISLRHHELEAGSERDRL